MLSVNDILKATNGKLLQGNREADVDGISTDSRALRRGEVFLAIRGGRFDGHRFVRQVEKKASAIIVERKIRIKKDIPIILVRDTVQALGLIARAHRRQFQIPIIAITGSTGKTTTKEMIAAVLQKRFRVLKNIATQNNHIGVPLTLLKMNATHEVAVLEFGTNRPGDIRWLTTIAEPTVAVFTNIGESHLELLKTTAGVFREKFGLVRYAKALTTIVVNNDDPYLQRISREKGEKKVVTFSVNNRADYQAKSIEFKGLDEIRFRVGNAGLFKLKTTARHNIYNAIVAICCGRLFKVGYNDIKKVLSDFEAPKGRQVVLRTGKYWLIDDTYNANPVSVRSAIGTLDHLQTKGKRIFVCGDMLELGKQSQSLHRSIGRYAAETSLDILITFGKEAGAVAQGARDTGSKMAVHHCASVKATNNLLRRYCRAGDVILVKGSRGMKMERITDFIRKNLSN